MNVKPFYFKALSFFFICKAALLPGFTLSVCAIFQNDSRFLKEWIEFHLEQGVEHFYLYNNISEDDYYVALQPFINKGKVDLIEWNYTYNSASEWTKIQCDSYMHCIRSHSEDHWIAFLDTDEFLFSPEKTDLKEVLNSYEKYSGIAVNWVMYGTSNVQRIPDDEKMVNHLVMRSDLSYRHNKHVKCIVKPKKVVGCFNPHFFLFNHPDCCVNEKEQFHYGCFTEKNSVNKLRINHYWTRDLDFFWNVKIPRRKKWNEQVESTIQQALELNIFYDPILSNPCRCD